MMPQGMMPEPGMEQGGPPPELLAALMGGAGAGGGMPPGMPPEGMGGGMMGGPPPPEPPPEQAPASPVEHLRQAIEHAQAALTMEPDDADSQALAKVVQGLYAILAQRQKEEQQVLGNPATQRVVSRASG
jgi:hypothetical protein